MKFELLTQDGRARRGRLALARGIVETPVFMPVGTYGTVKAMTPEELTGLGRADRARQHLPPDAAPGHRGDRRARRAASVHELAGADPHGLGRIPGLQPRGAAQADRGGRAVPFARQRRRGVADSGELDRRCRRALDADIVMVFDECTPYPATRDASRETRWSCRRAGRARSRAEFDRLGNPNALFGIVQGGTWLSRLRQASLDSLTASGSTATRSAAWRSASRPKSASPCSRRSTRCCRADRPRYLMGVGTPADIVRGRGARRRHVRLRHADAERAQRSPVHDRRASSGSVTAVHQTDLGRSTPGCAATPAATTRAPTCAISIAATRSSARGSIRSTTCTITWA